MNILETRIFFMKGQISRVVVLVDFTSVGKPYSDIRAIRLLINLVAVMNLSNQMKHCQMI